MKLLAIGSLSTLVLYCAITPMASASTLAQANPTTPTVASSLTLSQTPPITLVNLARQGYLQNQGIPSNDSLTFGIATGQITAEDLVKAGIQGKWVSPETLNDQGYINLINVQFQDILTWSVE